MQGLADSRDVEQGAWNACDVKVRGDGGAAVVWYGEVCWGRDVCPP